MENLKKLRTLCNQNGISCRGQNGGYLKKDTLLKKLYGGSGGMESPTQKLIRFINLITHKVNEGMQLHGRRRVLRQLGNNPALSDIQNQIIQWVYTAGQLDDQEVKDLSESLVALFRESMPAEPSDAELVNIELFSLYRAN